MAAGDITVFNEFTEDLGEKVHDFAIDTIKLAFIDDSVTPLADTNAPRWDITSSQDYDVNEVTDAGNYTADGVTIPVTYERTAGVAKLNDDSGDIEWNADPAGFGSPGNNKARWGILYNASATNKNAIAFVDFGSSGLDETAGAVRIYWPSNGILTVSAI
jgi:hypothetical protein